MRSTLRFAASSLLTIILLLLCSRAYEKKLQAAGQTPCSTATDVLCGLNPDETDQQQLDAFGVELITRLAGTGYPGDTAEQFAEPKWEDWHTKCDVLSVGSLCAPSSLRELHTSVFPNSDLLFSLRPPVQHRVSHTLARDQLQNVPPQLASVLYNDAAKAGIASGLAGISPSDNTMEKLKGGSMIAKTVWAIFSNGNHTQTIYKSNLTPDAERTWPPPRLSFLKPPGTGEHPLNLSQKYFEPATIGPSGLPCTPAGPSSIATVTEQCIHLYRNIPRIPKTNQRADDLAPLQICRPTCTAALVGIQLMVRTNDDHDWIWIAMWWTGKIGGPLANAPFPWNYYTIDVTNTQRNNLRADLPNIVFNPFLEGMDPPNGGVANCVNCHSYAAFTKGIAGAHTSKAAEGGDKNHGSPPLPPDGSTGVPPLQQSPIQAAYLAQSVQTDSLWSVAGNSQPSPASIRHNLGHASHRPRGSVHKSNERHVGPVLPMSSRPEH